LIRAIVRQQGWLGENNYLLINVIFKNDFYQFLMSIITGILIFIFNNVGMNHLIENSISLSGLRLPNINFTVQCQTMESLSKLIYSPYAETGLILH
jgi:hypothetical protein